ncbi:MAG: sigma 54-interacting transcriptional regulator [Nitrospirae bacterium]|nr:sigma 54-interacting transcriptional regulator [Nitrospirota bacterium]
MDLTPDTVTKLIYLGEKPTKLVYRKLLFRILKGPEKGRKFVSDRDQIRIGSAPDNQLVLADDTISRHHAEIRLDPKGFLVRDLGSTNGTFVNGVQVNEAYVPAHSTLTIGATHFTFEPLKDRVEVDISEKTVFGELVGISVLLRRSFALLEKVAGKDVTVLIEGETGTGKDLAARAIHQSGPRKSGPFVVFDGGSVPKNLAESELFGHVRGSFTGAHSDKIGAVEQAHRGTLFLDEIGELDLELQPKLLRALEQREVKKVGSTTMAHVDVRFIAATNKNLEEEVEKNRFRKDLFYRLNTIRITMPPLRERREDVPVLIDKFLKEFNAPPDYRLPPEAVPLFQSYSWPGNVRELRNTVQKMLVFSDPREALTPREEAPAGEVDLSVPFKEAKHEVLVQFERRYLSQLLSEKGYNVSESARSAGIDRKYLERMVKKLNLK